MDRTGSKDLEARQRSNGNWELGDMHAYLIIGVFILFYF